MEAAVPQNEPQHVDSVETVPPPATASEEDELEFTHEHIVSIIDMAVRESTKRVREHESRFRHFASQLRAALPCDPEVDLDRVMFSKY